MILILLMFALQATGEGMSDRVKSLWFIGVICGLVLLIFWLAFGRKGGGNGSD